MVKSKSRILSLLMAMVMLVTLAVPAMAAEPTSDLGTIRMVDLNGIVSEQNGSPRLSGANRISMVSMYAAPAIDYGGGQVGIYSDLATSTYVGENMYLNHTIPQNIIDMLPTMPYVANGFTGWYVEVQYVNDGPATSVSYVLGGVSQGNGSGGSGYFTVKYYIPHFGGRNTFQVTGTYSGGKQSACFAHLNTV
ncbi:MAG: hypothetical protein RSA86_07205 [Christensenellaceae bacterium]